MTAMDDHPNSHREIDRFVADILSAMSLKEKVLIANMEEKSLPYLQYAFDVYIDKEIGDDPQTGRKIMQRIWQTLNATHRIRLVAENGRRIGADRLPALLGN
jgi:hypothetical protein